MSDPSTTSAGTKSAAAAYLLWFFLGGLGIHRFYMGRTGSGFGMLGLAVGSFVLSFVVIGLIGYPVLFIWWLVDAFLIAGWLKEEASPVVGQVSQTTSQAA